ncbi:glycosyltransferase family 2 protein [Candidatus Gottesmanbacteria bacterium]|nr:glycosyltransferase family 2 protein [Candidatus Gottesmanbacteria bacterium]
MKKFSSLTIFFPTLNDAKILPYLIKRAYEAARLVTDDFEIVVINDGSTDDTTEVIKKLQKKYKNLRLVEHAKTLGYGAALQSGFASARKAFVFYTDGDGQYDPQELADLAKKMTDDVDVVNGYKRVRHDEFIRRLLGYLYNRLVHGVYRLPIRDIDCDFRLIRRELLDRFELTASSGVVCLELILNLDRAGARFVEVPVHHFPRVHGRSRFFTFRHLWNTFTELSLVFLHARVGTSRVVS